MGLHKAEKFEIKTLRRGEIHGAPYNPRVISREAKRRLLQNLKKVGMVQPIVWNEITGNVVSGHQRLEAMDSIAGSEDYEITVAVVRMDEKTEKEQNVFMNNTSAQGEFDLDKLHGMFKEDPDGAKLDFEGAGFDLGEMFQMFGEGEVRAADEQLLEFSQKQRDLREKYEKVKKEKNEKGDEDFYLVVVFRNNDTRDIFLKTVGAPDWENRYIDGKLLLNLLIGAGVKFATLEEKEVESGDSDEDGEGNE